MAPAQNSVSQQRLCTHIRQYLSYLNSEMERRSLIVEFSLAKTNLESGCGR